MAGGHDWAHAGEKFSELNPSGTDIDLSRLDVKMLSAVTDTISESTSATGVTIDGVILKDTTVDVNGTADALILDADADTTISSPTDDQIDFEVAGADALRITTEGMIRSAGYSDLSQRNRVRVFEDFLADAGATLPVPWGKQDTSAAGTPTIDYVADSANGIYTLTHDGTSEAQTMTLYWSDQLMIDPTKNPVMEVRLKINFAGANFSADQRIVIGLASARNATLDSVVSNVWFRIEGANLDILVEADDGTTDTDNLDTTINIVDNTYTTFRIDLSDLADIIMYVNGVAQPGGSLAAIALTASTLLQPFIEIQRDAGTEAEAVSIDYIMVEQDRV